MARFDETVNIRPVNTDTGFAQASNSLLNRLESFSQTAQTVAARKAIQKGQEEANATAIQKKDGVTVAPKKKEISFMDRMLTGGISARQYNKSMETAYLASLGNDIKEGISAIESENSDNIIQFNEKVNGYVNGVLKGVDPSIQKQVAGFIDGQVSNSRTRVHGRNIKKNKSDALAISSQAVTTFSNDAASLAREGNFIGAAESAIQAYTIIDGMVEAGDLSVDRASVMKREINREMTEQTKRKEFDDIITKDGFEVAFTKLEEDSKKVPKGWTPDEWDTYTSSQQTDINRQRAKYNAKLEAINKEASKALRQYEAAVSLGFEVGQQEKTRVKELVAGTSQQEQFDRINRIAAFSLLPIDERRVKLKELETGNLDDVADLTAMLRANNEINKAAITDGYSLGVRQGLINEISFDPSDPLSFSLKADQAETLSEHYGVSVSPLTDGEANSLSANIDKMTVAEKVQLANTLNSSPAVWAQISPKNQQVFPMAGASGDNVLMATVFKGQELLSSKLVTAAKPSEYLSVSDKYLADVYGIQDKAAIIETAKAHYAATAGNTDMLDEEAWKTSLNAVTGGIGDVNGNKVELPRGVDEDTFEDFISNYSASQVDALGGVLGFTKEQAANVIQDGIIKSVGANKYIVMVNGTQALFKADGTPFIIEYTQEQQAQQEAKKFVKAKTIEASISKLRSF